MVSVSVLGELEVTVDGVVVSLPRGLSRSLVMSLVVDIDRQVTDEDLIDRLWGGAAPANAHFSLRNTVSRLRSLLGHDVIERDEAGYRMSSTTVRTDLAELVARLAAADAAAADDRARLVESALALVRGPAYVSVRHEAWAAKAVAEADERVAAAEEHWAELCLVRGRVGAELGRLRAQAIDKPMRETRWRQLVDALVLDARRPEALRVAHEARQALAEFGMSVGPELRDAEHRALLDGDPQEAALTPGAAKLDATRLWPIVGRSVALRDLSSAADAHVVRWVIGHAGSGVTRVLAEAAALARDGGAMVCAVDVEAAGRGHRALDALAAELHAAALLATGAELAPVEPADPSPMPEVREARLRTELTRALTAVAGAAAVLVVIDNVHLLSSTDSRALAHVAREVVERGLPVSFLCGEEADVVGSGVLRRAVVDELGAGDLEGATVSLGSLGIADVVDLVALLDPRLDDDAVRRLAEAVVGATVGHPLATAELVRHQLTVGPSAPLPLSLEDAIQSRLSRLGGAAVDVVRVLAAAGRPVGATTLADASPSTRAAARSAIQKLVDERLVAELDGGRIDIRMPQLMSVALRSLSWSEVTRIRRRLIDLLEAQRDDPALMVHLLLATSGDRARRDPRLDGLVRDLLDRHVRSTDFDGAVALGRAYLATVGAADAHDAVELEIRVLLATALFAVGDVAEANSLVELVSARAAVLDLPELVADALLARGPIETGSSDALDIAERAQVVLPLLQPDDVERRVRLTCWAAHHLFNIGQFERGCDLLDSVDAEARAASRPLWKSLMLTMRVQQSLCVEGRPKLAVAALEELRAWSRLTGDEPAAIGAATMGLAVAGVVGTLDDVRAAADAIHMASRTMPRPDLRWLPEAVHAAVLLAAGDLLGAEEAVERAQEVGRRLSVGGAAAASTSQRLLLMLEGGTLGAMAPLMAPFAHTDDVPVALLAAWGLACAQAGDREGAIRAGELLRSRGTVLRGVGAAWPVVAMCAGEVAWLSGDIELARLLFEELRPWAGAGLAVYGLVHLGPADLVLGRAAAVLGQRATAEQLLDAAADQERRRGGAYWEKRALLAREHLDASR